MGLPWWYHFLEDHTIHNDIYDAFVEQRADTASLEKRMDVLEKSCRDMALHIQGLEALLAAHGIVPPASEDVDTTGPKPVGEPAVFPARTEESIACPRCGRRQRGNRNTCYSCGTPFQYENE